MWSPICEMLSKHTSKNKPVTDDRPWLKDEVCQNCTSILKDGCKNPLDCDAYFNFIVKNMKADLGINDGTEIKTADK